MTAKSELVRPKACAPGRVPPLAPLCYATGIYNFLLYVQHNKGLARRTSRQVRLLCPWARHLMGCLYL